MRFPGSRRNSRPRWYCPSSRPCWCRSSGAGWGCWWRTCWSRNPLHCCRTRSRWWPRGSHVDCWWGFPAGSRSQVRCCHHQRCLCCVIKIRYEDIRVLLCLPVQHGSRTVSVSVTDDAETVGVFLNPGNEQIHVLARLPGEDDPRLLWSQLLRHDDVLGHPLSRVCRLHSQVRRLVDVTSPHQVDVVEAVPRDGRDVVESLAVERHILRQRHQSPLLSHQADRAKHIGTGYRIVGLAVPGVHSQGDIRYKCGSSCGCGGGSRSRGCRGCSRCGSRCSCCAEI